MTQSPAFTITYWGVMGTFCGPLLPGQVTDKVVESISCMLEGGHLADLNSQGDLRQAVRAVVERELPFALRSTYGGNTTCVEVQTPEELIILDCGSGFRELGYSLQRRWHEAGENARRTAHVLLTHSHLDHTFATPFFTPYYDGRNAFTIWGPKLALESLAAVLDPRSAMSQIYFPPTYDHMSAVKSFRQIAPGADFFIGGTRIRTYGLNHPGGSMAYRLDRDGRSFVFATDHEHQEVPDRGLSDFANGADLLYTEGQYTAAEYAGEIGIGDDPPSAHHGWGHSPVESCVATALHAGVRTLHVGHRDPRRDDARTAAFGKQIREILADELQRAGKSAGTCEAILPYEGLQVAI